jgi:hypothetical protein
VADVVFDQMSIHWRQRYSISYPDNTLLAAVATIEMSMTEYYGMIYGGYGI